MLRRQCDRLRNYTFFELSPSAWLKAVRLLFLRWRGRFDVYTFTKEKNVKNTFYGKTSGTKGVQCFCSDFDVNMHFSKTVSLFKTFNMVVEIPRFSQAKFEINR